MIKQTMEPVIEPIIIEKRLDPTLRDIYITLPKNKDGTIDFYNASNNPEITYAFIQEYPCEETRGMYYNKWNFDMLSKVVSLDELFIFCKNGVAKLSSASKRKDITYKFINKCNKYKNKMKSKYFTKYIETWDWYELCKNSHIDELYKYYVIGFGKLITAGILCRDDIPFEVIKDFCTALNFEELIKSGKFSPDQLCELVRIRCKDPNPLRLNRQKK